MNDIKLIQSLDEFADGALLERFGLAMVEICDNITDINTNAASTRKLVIELAFRPSENRKQAEIDLKIKTKLEPLSSLIVDAIVGRDDAGNYVIAEQIDRQLELPLNVIDMNKEEVK